MNHLDKKSVDPLYSLKRKAIDLREEMYTEGMGCEHWLVEKQVFHQANSKIQDALDLLNSITDDTGKLLLRQKQ